MKGYVVRGIDGVHGVQVWAESEHDYVWEVAERATFPDLDAADSAARMMRDVKCTEVTILALGEDGAETQVLGHAEALARLADIQRAIEGVFVVMPANNNQPRVFLRGAGVELVRHRRSLADMRLPENVADANAILADAVKVLQAALEREPSCAHRMGRDLQAGVEAWRLDVVPEIVDEVEAHRDTQRALKDVEEQAEAAERAWEAEIERLRSVLGLARRLIESSDVDTSNGARVGLACDQEPFDALRTIFDAERQAERTIPGLVCAECERPIYKGDTYAGKGGHAAHRPCRNWPKGTTFKVAGAAPKAAS